MFFVSQEICNPENLEYCWMRKYYIEKMFEPTQENKSHIQNLKGARINIWTLLANIDQQNHLRRKSFLMPFLSLCHIMNMKVPEV